MLIIWLVIKNRTIAIDSSGFEVAVSRPLGQMRAQRFRWQDVIATSLITKTYRGESSSFVKHAFSVSIKGKTVEMIERGKYFRRDLIDVMVTANAGTMHLSYIWEECREKETRKILDTVPPYCKIARY